MLSVIAVIFVFSVLVIVHELGHFLAAKWMGVRVEKFSIGFPPKLFSKKIGDTEFVFSAIPLGGYVKLAGFIDESLDSNITGAPDEFNSKPIWKRIVIMTAGVVMNLILAVTVLSVLNFTEGKKILPTTTVGDVNNESTAGKVGFQKYDIITHVNDEKINSWNDFEGKMIEHLSHDIIFTVQRGDKVVGLTYRKEWFEKGEIVTIQPLLSSMVGDVQPDMPAAELGLKHGDEILFLDSVAVNDWEAMTKIIQKNPDRKISIKWRSAERILSGYITPKAIDHTDSTGNAFQTGLIGISYYYEFREIGLLESVQNGVTGTYDLIVLNMKGIWWVVTGKIEAKSALGGPITIARMVGDAAEIGWAKLWMMIAALSSILAFFNILPIPALDGGHIMVLMIEGAIRRPLSIKVRIKIQQIGLAVLLTLIVLVLYIDISRL